MEPNDFETNGVKIHYPEVCNVGDIPDYLAPLYTEIVTKYIPQFLSKLKLPYMVIGGRASNIYSLKKVPSTDWDIVVDFGGESLKDNIQSAFNLTNIISKFIEKNLSKSWARPIKISVSFKEFDTYYLFQIGMTDPYSDRDIKFIDIHTCHESTVVGVGQYCNYIKNAVFKEDIAYAPLEYMSKELSGMDAIRRNVFQKTYDLYKQDFSGDIEIKRAKVINLIAEIQNIADDEMDENESEKSVLPGQNTTDFCKKSVSLTDSKRIEKMRKKMQKLEKYFDKYSSYCEEKLSYQILTYREKIKYDRTHDRKENFPK